MTEFKAPTFGEEPRKESPGEARQRYASIIQILTGFMGVDLKQDERERLGRFVVNVLAQLTIEQQKTLAEVVGKLLAWFANRQSGE